MHYILWPFPRRPLHDDGDIYIENGWLLRTRSVQTTVCCFAHDDTLEIIELYLAILNCHFLHPSDSSFFVDAFCWSGNDYESLRKLEPRKVLMSSLLKTIAEMDTYIDHGNHRIDIRRNEYHKTIKQR